VAKLAEAEKEVSVDEKASELQRRMLARQQKSRRRKKDSLALTAIAVSISFGVAFLWHQVSPSKSGTEHAASHIGLDQEGTAQSDPGQGTPTSP